MQRAIEGGTWGWEPPCTGVRDVLWHLWPPAAAMVSSLGSRVCADVIGVSAKLRLYQVGLDPKSE